VTLEVWLQAFLSGQGAVAGTVHLLAGEVLELAAAVNIPPPVLEKTRQIPKGKGMAGLAWERNRAVSTCNLKTDATGDVQPGAKAVNAHAAVAIPVHDVSGVLRAVVGIAFRDDRELSEQDLRGLEQAAKALPGGG
jgi:hypothetical protein